MTAVDTAGAESPYSPEASKVIPPPNPAAPAPPAVICQVPLSNWFVTPITGATSRPLYNDAFAQIGRVEFLTADSLSRTCEALPVVKPGTTTRYRYATNNAGLRGLTICKERQ